MQQYAGNKKTRKNKKQVYASPTKTQFKKWQRTVKKHYKDYGNSPQPIQRLYIAGTSVVICHALHEKLQKFYVPCIQYNTIIVNAYILYYSLKIPNLPG